MPRPPPPVILEAEFAQWMLDERGWSRATRRTRLSTIRHARTWLAATHKRGLIRARREHVLAFIAAANHPRTRNRRLSDLRAFYRFLRVKGYRKTDPTADLERVREPRNLPRPLSRPAAVRLLGGARMVGFRVVVVVGLLLMAGLRREEAATLAWSDVDLEAGLLRVLGKGSKERVIPMHPSLGELLHEWKGQRGGGGYLFESGWRTGRPISPVTLWRDVALAAAVARVPGVSPHRCRHTFATEYLRRNPDDIRGLQVLMGHASLKTTEVYTKIVLRDLRPRVARLDFGG